MKPRVLALLGGGIVALALLLSFIGYINGWSWLMGSVAILGGPGGALIGTAWRRACLTPSGKWAAQPNWD